MLSSKYGRLTRKAGPAQRVVGRKKVRDVAFTFRMGAGFPGSVNRSHPAFIEPAMNDVTNAVAFYGEAVLVNTAANSVRGIISSDTSNVAIYGVAARNFPVQQSTAATAFAPATIGGLVAPLPGEVDVLREGYIIVPINGAVTKGGTVYVWSAATSGAHTQGGFEASSPGGSGFQATNAYFNGPADSNGFGEIVVRLAP